MTTCPACAQPVSPNQDACPKCGIPLHHGVDSGPHTAGNARSAGLAIGIVAVIGVGLVILLLCGGGLGFFLFAARSVAVPAAVKTVPPAPPITVEVESAPAVDELPAERDETPTP